MVVRDLLAKSIQYLPKKSLPEEGGKTRIRAKRAIKLWTLSLRVHSLASLDQSLLW